MGERRPQRRCAGDDRDAAVADRLDGGCGVEPLDEHDGGADAESEPDHHVEPEDVEQRQHAVDHVVGADVALRGTALIEVGLQVAVGEHRRAGRAGGSAGEHEHRDLRAVDVDRLDGAGREQVVEGDDVVGAAARRVGEHDHLDRRHRGAVDVRPVDGAEVVDHDGASGDDRQLGLEFGTGAGRVERHGDRSETDGGEVGDHEVRRVADHDGDPIVGADPAGGETAAERRHLVAEFAVGA